MLNVIVGRFPDCLESNFGKYHMVVGRIGQYLQTSEDYV